MEGDDGMGTADLLAQFDFDVRSAGAGEPDSPEQLF